MAGNRVLRSSSLADLALELADDTEVAAVQVAVRVRPFNATDGPKPKQIITMEGNACKIIDPTSGQQREFLFDHCFNSFWDGTGARPDHFADQETVWKALGVQVVSNAFKGFNSCLFAYGQSGAGKSFSMVANPPEPTGKGIVPRAMKHIFQHIDETKDPNVEQTVEVQMVRCLFVCLFGCL